MEKGKGKGVEQPAKATFPSVPEAPDGVIASGFMDVGEASEFLSISRSKCYQLMDTGQLVYAKFGGSRRIPKRAVLEYAERCLVRTA